MATEMSSPRLPLGFSVSAFFKTVPPLLGCGGLYVTPKTFPSLLGHIGRWGFSVSTLISLGAVRYPNRLALVDDFGELTYTQFNDQCRALARALMDRGMTSGTSFGVMARNGRGIIMPMAAKGFIGAEIMLLNIGSSSQQVEGIIDQNNVKFLFIDDEFIDRVPETRPDVQVIITTVSNPETRKTAPKHFLFMEDLIEEGRTSNAKFETRPKQGRIIIMSSGTTGIPKGVLRDEPKTPNSAGAIAQRIPWKRNMVIHQSASMFHAWGWANVLLAMGTGATLLTMRIFDAKVAIDQCEKYGANGMISAAFFLRQLDDELHKQPHRKIGPFKFIVSSGNAIPAWLVKDLIERFGPVVCNFYGSTEAGLTSIATGEDLARHPDSAGRPAVSAMVKILDEAGNEVPTGEVGLIYTAEASSFTGYLNPTDKFKTVDGLLRMGDLGRIDEEGYLYICGRADDMVIKGGENIFPREVEEVLGKVPGIADCYCRGLSGHTDDLFADLYLYVVHEDSEAGKALTAEQLQEYIRKNLSEPSVPDKVIFMDKLPRNAVGKVVPREIDDELGDH